MLSEDVADKTVWLGHFFGKKIKSNTQRFGRSELGHPCKNKNANYLSKRERKKSSTVNIRLIILEAKKPAHFEMATVEVQYF